MVIDRDVDGKNQVMVLQKSKSKTDDIDDENIDFVDEELTASVKSKLKVTDDEKINVKENIVDDADDVDDKESGVRKKKKKKKKKHEDGTKKNVKDVDNLPVDTDDEKWAVPVQNKLKKTKRKNKNFDNVGSSSDEKKENEKTATKKIAAAPTKKESGTTVPATKKTESSSSKDSSSEDSSDEEEKLVKNPIAKKTNKVAKKYSTMDINDGEVIDPVKSRSKAKNKKPANQTFFEKLEKLSEKTLSNEVKENIVYDVDDKKSGGRKKKKKKAEDGTKKNVEDNEKEHSKEVAPKKVADEKKEKEETATKKVFAADAAAPSKKAATKNEKQAKKTKPTTTVTAETAVPSTISDSSSKDSDDSDKKEKTKVKTSAKAAVAKNTDESYEDDDKEPIQSKEKKKKRSPEDSQDLNFDVFIKKLEKLNKQKIEPHLKHLLYQAGFKDISVFCEMNLSELIAEMENKPETFKYREKVFKLSFSDKIILQGLIKKSIENQKKVSEESETDDSDDEPSSVTKDFMNLLGVTTIKQSIQSGYYVDKTRQIQRLIEGKGHYFLIRPRRFGKTLMLDTAAVICEGTKNKKLFKNTHIGKSTTYQWKKHPVFQFTFSKLCKESIEEFKLSLIGQIKDNCRKYNIKLKKANNIATLVKYMLDGGANLKNGYDPRVIVLIDEYDAPLNRCYIDKSKIVNILTDFFENLKGGHEKVVLTTGASRFGLAEVLTAANDICDITLANEFSDICGFTQTELTTVFKDKINEMSTLLSIKDDQLLNEMKEHYNGFKFSEHAKETVYNPWSVIQCFLNNAIRSYWDGKNLSGYSSLLLNDCESLSFILEDPKFIANGSALTFDKDFKEITLKSLLFQTGYLTIQEFNQKTKMYILKVPNNETKYLLKEMMEKSPLVKKLQSNTTQLFKAIIYDDFSQLVQSLRVYYAGWPYHAPMCEASAHIFFHAILTLLCEHTTSITFKSERTTRTGRCDVLLQTSKYSYIIELKFSKPTDSIKKTARQSIKQIYDNKYYVKDLNYNKIIIFIGIVVDSHDLIDWERIQLSEYDKKVLQRVARRKKQIKLQPAKNDENSLKNKKEHGGNSRGGNFDNNKSSTTIKTDGAKKRKREEDADKTAAESTPNKIAKNNYSNGFNSNKPAKDDENCFQKHDGGNRRGRGGRGGFHRGRGGFYNNRSSFGDDKREGRNWNKRHSFNGNRRGGGNLFNGNRNLIGSIDALPQNKITKFEE